MLNSSKTYFTYDSVLHNLIELDYYSQVIIETDAFQRLKEIKQLGPAYHTFKMAKHTRFEHSIGTAWLARNAAKILVEKNIITPRDALNVEISGLCHDIGHGPGSHSFDNAFKIIKEQLEQDKKIHTINNITTYHHESRSIKIVKYIFKNTPKLEKNFTQKDIDLICYIIDPEKCPKPDDKISSFLCEIVNNPIHHVDVDKMDYLMRDAKYLDINLIKEIDIISLLRRCEVINNHWVFDVKDQHIIDGLLYRRIFFFSEYYQNPDCTEIESMYIDIFRAIYKENPYFLECSQLKSDDDYRYFFKLTDNIFITILNDDKYSKHVRNMIKTMFENIGNNEKPIQYEFKGDYHSEQNISEEDVQVPFSIYIDKSCPLNTIPKVMYHQNGKIVKNPDKNVYRVIRRNFSPNLDK